MDSNISSWLSVLPLAIEVSLICQPTSLGMVLLYIIRSHCYHYLPYVMVVEHRLVLNMPLIVALEAWSLIGIRNEVQDAFSDLASLVWAIVVKESVVCDGSAGADTMIADLCVQGNKKLSLRTKHTIYRYAKRSKCGMLILTSLQIIALPLNLSQTQNITGTVSTIRSCISIIYSNVKQHLGLWLPDVRDWVTSWLKGGRDPTLW